MNLSKKNINLQQVKSAAKNVVKYISLVPQEILLLLWAVSLVTPNLVYSGAKFADTLHILKWSVTAIPVLLALLIAGVTLFFHNNQNKFVKLEPKFDLFALVWLVLLIYCGLQYFWTDISSTRGFIHELLCFAAVWAFYVLSVDSFPDWGLRPILWLANINGALNVLFAELQIRGMNNLEFLRGGMFESLIQYRNIILPTPGNYIGNTAQQNMFGLWMAICVMSSVYLFIAYAVSAQGKKRPLYLTLLNIFLMLVNTWGLWNSTSRSGILSLFAGLFVLGLITIMRYGKKMAVRFGIIICVCIVFLAGAVMLNQGRTGGVMGKITDMIENAGTVGGRKGIWTTSYAMFDEHPMGVGIGQYKWHYLEAQRHGFNLFNNPDWYIWQYTHWAHNEFLQFFCEAGIIGGALLILLYLIWLLGIISEIYRRVKGEARSVSPNAIWGCALIALISFNALWTRPFHRIENIVWLALAFALTNREFLSGKLFKFNLSFNIKLNNIALKLVSLACAACAIGGILYLSSGIKGNLVLRRALSTTNQRLQLNLLEEAVKHPITYEEAQRNLGHHYFQVGDQTHDMPTMSKGFNLLWQHFQREPHSEDMNKLIQWSQRFQIEPVIRELASLLKPNTYHLVTRQGVDQNGNKVNALVIANGPAPK